LQRWDAEGKIKATRTVGGHRRFDVSNLLGNQKDCSYQVDRLVLTHKDRLLRLGSDLIFSLCEIFGTEVIIINSSPIKRGS
jgi:predicted site-specific integrase-resolvase